MAAETFSGIPAQVSTRRERFIKWTKVCENVKIIQFLPFHLESRVSGNCRGRGGGGCEVGKGENRKRHPLETNVSFLRPSGRSRAPSEEYNVNFLQFNDSRGLF